MTQFINMLQWEGILLLRYKLVQVSVLVTALYIGLFQVLKLLGNSELFAMLLTLNDPALIGMLFVAVTILFERESGSLNAVFVSPLRLHAYLSAKLLSLALLGTICGWAMTVALLGTGIQHFGFLIACFLITWLFGCLGIILVAPMRRFVDFLLPMAGILMLMIVPLLDWFGIATIPGKWLFPMEHGLQLLAWSMNFKVQSFPWLSLGLLIAACIASYFWGYTRFVNDKTRRK